MTYISWAAFHEGTTDAAYLEILIPRLMEELVLLRGVHHSDIPASPAVRLGNYGRAVEIVAKEACDAKDAFELVFIHADTGGRSLEAGVANRSVSYCEKMHEVCNWPVERCITVVPRHETEAWILADPTAVIGALGYQGMHQQIGLPDDAQSAERLVDPKAILKAALREVAGPRRRSTNVQQLFPAIA